MQIKLNFLINFIYKLEKFINKHKKKSIFIFIIILYAILCAIGSLFGKTHIRVSAEDSISTNTRYMIVFKKADNFNLCKSDYRSAPWIEGNDKYSDYLLSFDCYIDYDDFKKNRASYFGFYYTIINIDDIVPKNLDYYELTTYYPEIFKKADTIPDNDWNYKIIDLTYKLELIKHQEPIGNKKPIYLAGIPLGVGIPIGIPNPLNNDKIWEYKINITTDGCSSCNQDVEVMMISNEETLTWANPNYSVW